MGDSSFSFKIDGLDRLLKKVGNSSFINSPMRKFWERSAISVVNRARQNAPTDTGRLRASITHEVDDAALPLYAKVGTDVFYARYMEYGTGAVGDPAVPHVSWHVPPADALGVWASRHGSTGAQVASAIGKRGGLLPRLYLRKALEDSLGDIRGFVERLAADIQDAWSGGNG